MRKELRALIVAATMTASACADPGREPLRSTIFVPAGYFRAQTLCGARFQRACELSYAPPIGKSRHRVMMWLDAFWAETDLVRKVDYEACRVGVVLIVPRVSRVGAWLRPAAQTG